LTNFVAIRTHLFRLFHLAVDFLGLCRNGSSSQVIYQGQVLLEQFPRNRNLGQLEGNVPPVSDDLGPNLHQLFAQRGQRPVLHRLRQGQGPHEVAQIVGQDVKLKPNLVNGGEKWDQRAAQEGTRLGVGLVHGVHGRDPRATRSRFQVTERSGARGRDLWAPVGKELGGWFRRRACAGGFD